jgi:hypothetical protein
VFSFTTKTAGAIDFPLRKRTPPVRLNGIPMAFQDGLIGIGQTSACIGLKRSSAPAGWAWCTARAIASSTDGGDQGGQSPQARRLGQVPVAGSALAAALDHPSVCTIHEVGFSAISRSSSWSMSRGRC